MADPEQIASQVRFQLSQMRAKNQHHDFEKLAFHLIRTTVASNVLPATGPVGAGGDQGRDFETFRSYIASSELRESSFAALVSGRTIAFACSLQTDILPKIKADVATMQGSGTRLDEAHYFCETDIPAGKRHALQAWAREKYGIHLEVHDGQAIATELTNKETFWIAQRYLAIDADIWVSPTDDDLPEWYQEARAKYDSQIEIDGPADLETIRRAGRFATDDPAVRTDVPFWIDRLLTLYHGTESLLLRRKAVVEIVAISMRSTRVLEGVESLIREHFSDVSRFTDPQEIEDAGSTLTYALVSARSVTCALTVDELRSSYDALTARVDVLLNGVNKPGLQSDLLELAGMQRLTAPLFRNEFPDSDSAIKYWIEITRLLPDAPFFHLSRFADRLTEFAVLLGDHPRYRELTSVFDEHLEQRMGGLAAGAKGRDRAMAFYEAGQVRRAIEELHNVKVKWFAQESLRGAILSLLLLSSWYRDLGLSFAGKYYALTGAFLSFTKSGTENLARYMGPALANAALCDWRQGAVASIISIVRVTTLAFAAMMKPSDDDFPEVLEELVGQLAIMTMVVRRLAPSEAEELKRLLCEIPLVADGLDTLLPIAEETWKDVPLDEVWSRIAVQLQDVPLSDTGSVRIAAWTALGIRWRVKWENTRDATAMAEQFCAVLQITLLDLSRVDLALLPTTVDVTLQIAPDAILDLHDEPSNEGRRWAAVLPVTCPESEFHDFTLKMLAMASHILSEVSLLKQQDFHDSLEDAFKSGIANKIAFGRPYDELYRAFVSEDDFHLFRSRTTTLVVPSTVIFRETSPELAWIGTPGPTYSGAEAKRQIQARLERAMKPIRYTIEFLNTSADFAAIVVQLRNEGWKDWHLVLALMNLVINQRVHSMIARGASLQDTREAFQKISSRDERKSDVSIAASEVTAEGLRAQLELSRLHTLHHWDLELRQRTPDVPAVERFLAVRYRYWLDDVEHNPIF